MNNHKTPRIIREKARQKAEKKRRENGIPKRMGGFERFWAKVFPVTESGCWLWFGSTCHSGHGQIYWGGKTRRAHRVSWEMAFSPVPEGLSVLHKCDIPCCVNPAHLFLGTQTDNMRDMWEKGRGSFGESAGQSKLTREDVWYIRDSPLAGSKLAKMFGVSHSTICDIRSRRSWRNV